MSTQHNSTSEQPSVLPAGLLGEVQHHLEQVKDAPAISLDERLLDRFDAYIPSLIVDSYNRALLDGLVLHISSMIPGLQQNPAPINKLLIRLLEPYSFTDVLALTPEVNFAAGLEVSFQPFNILVLTLLEKATRSPSEAAIVAGKTEVVSNLIRLWLCTSEVEIAEKAAKVLWGLLRVDYPVRPAGVEVPTQETAFHAHREAGGQGLMWRRIFKDKDMYGLIFSLCSLKTLGQERQPSKRDKTLAQARLMDFIPKIAQLDWEIISQPQIPEVETAFGLQSGQGGLLDFAAIHMVDIKDDVLMHMTLIDFFSKLLQTASPVGHETLAATSPAHHPLQSSRALEYLISRGLHSRTSSFYLEPENPQHDPIDVIYLGSRSANYLSVYASTYPLHLLSAEASSPTSVERILARISSALDISPGKWAQGDSPKHDLHLLASLPRVALLPQLRSSQARSSGGAWQTSPVSLLPTSPANADALSTLGTIFHGPPYAQNEIRFPPKLSDDHITKNYVSSEAAAARALYLLYVFNNQAMYKHVVQHAETVALKETAIAAIQMLANTISANWTGLSNSGPGTKVGRFLLPSDEQIISLVPLSSMPTPPAVVPALLASPGNDALVPYLLSPAQTFSNLVGGRGDTESVAYKVAVAKYDTLKLFHKALVDVSGQVNGLADLTRVVAERIAEGPWSPSGEVGGRIGTLEL